MSLNFGIPTLDELLEIPGQQQKTKTKQEYDTTSLALLGPDGSGKSVLALHLASQYRRMCSARLAGQTCHLPQIIYVSSDLQFESADTVWDNFGLNKPNDRRIPFEGMPEEVRRRLHEGHEVRLVPLTPGGDGDFSEVNFLLTPDSAGSLTTKVGFVDLARHSAGDDWNYVNSLIVNLEASERPKVHGQELSHLVIIDSVAGFETFVGKLDAYGMEQTRRARIAQSMRNAYPHAHLVFVVEEPDEGKRLPEEYVTDVVIRLRSRREGGRALRTVEVEKARARTHATGEHTFEIRGAHGSSTGAWENPDTPASQNAYVHVFHSLSHRNLLIAADRGPGKWEKGEKQRAVTPFGLHYLDHLLEQGQRVRGPGSPARPWGIRAGSTAAVIGDGSTGKSVLAEKFIAEGFRGLVEDALAVYLLLANPTTHRDAAGPAFRRVCELLSQPALEFPPAAGEAGEEERKPSLKPKPEDVPPEPEPTPPAPTNLAAVIGCFIAAWEKGKVLSEAALRATYGVPATDFPLETDIKRRQSVLKARRVTVTPSTLPLGVRVEPAKSRSDCYASLDRIRELQSAPDLLLRGPGELLKALFRHPNLRAPGVVLTNADRNVFVLAERCLGYLRRQIGEWLNTYQIGAGESKVVKGALRAIKAIIEEQLIVRRFDIDSMPASALFDMVQRNLAEAQNLLHGEHIPERPYWFSKSDRIRLVIDDMRVIATLCPSVSTDSAFLPFLVFSLEREGITSLIVHTAPVRPGTRPDEPVSQELLSLLKQLILTWNVPFDGRTRIAITSMPARSPATNGLVREVKMDRVVLKDEPLAGVVETELPKVEVSPNFELYADIELGNPRLVPLAVFLYSFTPAFRKYMDGEDLMYREQFAPVPGTRNGESGRVLWPIDARQYYAIRDLTHLPWDAKADYTIVNQVDGFWSLDAETGALAPQNEYLMSTELGADEDPFHLFRGTPLHLEAKKGDESKGPRWPRQYFFQNSEYRSRIVDFQQQNLLMPDRVPFMWDFGFLLAPVAPWQAAFRESKRVEFQLAGVPVSQRPEWFKKRYLLSTIFGRLRDKPRPRDPNPEVENPATNSPGDAPSGSEKASSGDPKVVPWRLFLGACKGVADLARQERALNPVGFDFAATSSETLASLFFEIWFSEITMAVHQLRGSTEIRDQTQIENWKKWLSRLSSPVYEPLPLEARKNFSLAMLLGGDLAKKFKAFKKDYIDRAEQWSVENLPDGLIGEAAVAAFEDGPGTFDTRKLLFRGLPLEALSLYKTWLLLLDVLDFEAVLDPDNASEMKQPKEASRQAIAVRHYYRTACDAQAASAADTASMREPHIALGMPGFFSVRGDSFLASPLASRSRLLASHAIDLLCSRRANLTRLQMGLGLPVRDVLPKEACKAMRTSLRVLTIDRSQFNENTTAKNLRVDRPPYAMMEITYEALCGLGGLNDEKLTPLPDQSPSEWRRRWLFRNGIPEYDRVSRATQRWLVRLFKWTMAYKGRHPLGWDGGFKGYDALSVYRLGPLLAYQSFTYVPELCDSLFAELGAAERRDSGH